MFRSITNRLALLTIVLLAALVARPAAGEETKASAADKKFLLQKQPKEAFDVIGFRKDAKDAKDVVVVGRIGGRQNPWIKNSAAFSIVDRSLRACNEIPGDTCKTPWDFCCESNLPKATLFVMLTDENGKVIKQDARELLHVKELDTVYIQGKAKRDKAGNVSIMASKVFIARDNKEKKP